ncbi:MAG: carbohydrate-binding family 9-like protein [Kiritimatiellia bacterium]|jgi:hypothetical protein
MSEETAPPRYTIHRASRPPSLAAEVGSVPAGWSRAEVGVIENWHEKSSSHRPLTYFRVLYDRHALYVHFDVMDRHVRCIRKKPQSNVCEDSCVEFFVQPAPGKAYFNFEISAAGTMLLYFIEDARRLRAGGFHKYAPVAPEWLRQVEIGHSLPGLVRRPIAGPLAWAIAYRIPLALFTAHLGECGVARGDVWRGNFFKCGGDPAYPHWGMWSDVGKKLNFHQPQAFGELVFG